MIDVKLVPFRDQRTGGQDQGESVFRRALNAIGMMAGIRLGRAFGIGNGAVVKKIDAPRLYERSISARSIYQYPCYEYGKQQWKRK